MSKPAWWSMVCGGSIVIGCAWLAMASTARAQEISANLEFEKTNEILLDTGPAGAFDECQAKYPCVLKVGNEWWMWYNGRAADCFTGDVGVAVSLDGLTWTKANGGRSVLAHGPEGTFDSTKVDHPAVLHFDGRFHMWYTAGDKDSRYKIGYATSPDGLVWTRENDDQPVLGPGAPGKFDDQVVLHPAVVRDDQDTLHLWYNGVGPQKSFRVGHATSTDGIHWTRQNNGDPVLVPSRLQSLDEGYVYNVYVLYEKGSYHMWYSAWAQGEPTTGLNHNCIVYASSTDGTHWTKDDSPTLSNGTPGSLDSYACFAPCIVRRDGKLWMYYSAGSGITSGPYRVSLAKSR